MTLTKEMSEFQIDLSLHSLCDSDVGRQHARVVSLTRLEVVISKYDSSLGLLMDWRLLFASGSLCEVRSAKA